MSKDAIELIKLVLPVVTFAAGTFFSRIFVWLDRRRELSNIRTMLFEEMNENYKILALHVPLDEPEKLELLDSRKLVFLLARLSSSVYDAYLDRLCKLKSNERHKIYKAYAQIELATRGSVKYLNEAVAIGAPVRDALLALTRDVVDALAQALLLFKHFSTSRKTYNLP